MRVDPFSDVLELVQARSVISGGFVAGGRWGLRFPPPEEIKFFAVVKGRLVARLDGQRAAIEIGEGDVGLLAGRRGYVVASSLDAPMRDAMRVFGARPRPITIGTGADCAVIAGGVALDPAAAALLTDALPPVVHVRAASPHASGLRWIVEQIAAERTSVLPGSQLATAQLAQLLFVQVLRAHLSTEGALPIGWLRALRDERLAAALQLMHGDPARAWRLTELAKAAAMSRTTFAVHFKAVVGSAPLAYLAAWRMRLAQRRLRDADAPIASIAASLGYASESAFSQAFKRITGTRPRDYRNDRDSISDARSLSVRRAHPISDA